MTAVVIDAVRSPLAPPAGALKGWHPVSLLAEILKASAARAGVDPARVQRVIAGCATPIGDQACNVGRNAVLAAGWPERVPATTMDGHAAASILALSDIVALVNSKAIELGVAAGVESATRVPDGATSGVAVGKPFGPLVHQRYETAGGLVSPGLVSEALAHDATFTRMELDNYGQLSRQRYQNAQKTGAFKGEICTLAAKNDKGVDTASHVFEDSLAALEKVSRLAPIFEREGLITAASFTGPADGAAALMVADSQLADAEGWPVLARVLDVQIMGTSPINGYIGVDLVKLLMKRNGLKKSDVSRIEVYEDSSVTPLAMTRQLGLKDGIVNPGGGALATGAALGAVGVGLVTTLAHGLVQDQGRYGIAIVAGSGGMAGAALLERH